MYLLIYRFGLTDGYFSNTLILSYIFCKDYVYNHLVVFDCIGCGLKLKSGYYHVKYSFHDCIATK